MENSEEVQLFNKEEQALLIKEMGEKGILGEWENPLSAHYMAVKGSCDEYFTDLVGYEVLLIDNSTGTDRVLYDPARHSRERAREYGDSSSS